MSADSDARLGRAIKELARMPGGVGKSVQIVVGSGDWEAIYEIRLLRVRAKTPAKRAGAVLVIHPMRSAPGKRPR